MTSNILREDLFPGNTYAYGELRELLGTKKLIAMTGAGTSVPAYPAWTPLLKDLINQAQLKGFITSATDAEEYLSQVSTNPLELANSLEIIFQRHNFREILAAKFRSGSIKYTDAQKLIVTLGPKAIITTNYDDGIEQAYTAFSSSPAQSSSNISPSERVRWIQGEVYGEGKCPILHWHGTPSNPNDMIFTGDDYDKFYSRSENVDFIHRLWQGERIIAIGYGFSDPFLNRIAEQALRSLETADRHFALIGLRDKNSVSHIARQQFSRRYRITPIFYKITKKDDQSEDHSALLDILNDLVSPPAFQHESASVKEISENQDSRTEKTDSQLIITSGDLTARKDFEGQLFSAPNGKPLYVEPQLLKPTSVDIDAETESYQLMTVKEIIDSNNPIIFSAKSE